MGFSFILIAERILIVYRNYFHMLLIFRHDRYHLVLCRQTVGGIGNNQNTVSKFLKQLIKRICGTLTGRERCGIRFELLRLRMSPFLYLDPHADEGGYMIRSLYFDDYWNSAYEEKEAGILMRKKYRIRIYNYSDRSIKLERKKKHGSYIFKESAPLTREEVEKILAGDYEFLLKSQYPLCREFYVECVSNMMRPRTIVDYDREPWIMDEGTVRVTFDRDVRAAIGSFDIFDPTLPTLPVLEPGKLVMEVKFTEMLPQIVRDILPPHAAEFTAVSKYVLCYEKTRYMNGFEYWYETQEREIL